MHVSVIVCTYNRCESLRETLRAISNQVVREGLTFELIVVDNNSRDKTRRVVEEAAADSPWPVRYVFEATQGLSHARNRGIREARGEILLFTDDDVRPDARWVQAITDAFVTYGADCVGGKILPQWAHEPPAWLRARKRLWVHFAMPDCGDAIHWVALGEGRWIRGANMAFRRSIFERLGFFRTDLGGCGRRLLGGEDVEMIRRVAQDSGTVLYEPQAVVYHCIGPERMRLGYFRRLHFDRAISRRRWRTDSRLHDTTPIPGWLIRSCLSHGVKALGTYLTGRRDIGIDEELVFWTELGLIVGGTEVLLHGRAETEWSASSS